MRYTIKPLEWEPYGDGERYRADSCFGLYYLTPSKVSWGETMWWARGVHGTNQMFPTREEAASFVETVHHNVLTRSLTPVAPDTPGS